MEKERGINIIETGRVGAGKLHEKQMQLMRDIENGISVLNKQAIRTSSGLIAVSYQSTTMSPPVNLAQAMLLNYAGKYKSKETKHQGSKSPKSKRVKARRIKAKANNRKRKK